MNTLIKVSDLIKFQDNHTIEEKLEKLKLLSEKEEKSDNMDFEYSFKLFNTVQYYENYQQEQRISKTPE